MAAVPFILALFVLSHLLLLNFHSVSAEDNKDIQITCPKSFDCKPLGRPLNFPFSNSTEYSQCGLCTVTCDQPYPPPLKIQLGNEKPGYDVVVIESMSDNNVFQVQIHDPILQYHLDHRICYAFNNLNFPNSPSISYTISHNLTFIRCDKISTYDYFKGFHNYTVCADSNYYYKYPEDQYLAPANANLSRSCSVIQLPMNTSIQNPNVNDPFNLLAATFSLELRVSDDCQKCHHRGGQCQNDNQKFHCAKTEGGGGDGGGVGTNFRLIHSPKKKNFRLILGTAIPGGVILIICLLIFIIRRSNKWNSVSSYFISRNTSSNPSSKADIEGHTIFFGVLVFSYSELEEATNNFDPLEELGDGGFGTVYHGKLRDGREVAVKRLYEHNYKQVTQFMNEVEILTRLRHPNLVSLYGCTSRHSRELLLVYEYIPNGTVADHLHGDRAKDGSLTWPIRMNIAIETAGALAYLHASEIIHRDVKTNNILLDNNFCVKVADFGLSRLFPIDVTHVSTAPQGTPGYVDPEYYQCYQLTDKSDVYSFGVVLIELVSSLPAVDINRDRHEINLANLAINRIQNHAFNELIDPFLGFESDSSIERMTTLVAELAFRCLQREKEMRPTMDEVLEALKAIQEYKYDNIGEEMDTVGVLNCAQPPPSPEAEGDGVVLLKNSKVAPSSDSVTDRSVSTSTTSVVSSG